MRIESVTAKGFGPFANQTLELAPGMTVVHGPNESGKTSWYAAIYAGLCGMRRTRGRATLQDQAFADRHRPWRRGVWEVTARVRLDDGTGIELQHVLGPGGRSVALDVSTKRPFGTDLVHEGAVDGAALLGLSRDVAGATIFVGQDEVVRVLAEAAGLQEYLERAAATSAVDTTGEEALTRLASYHRERVGLVRSGSRGPLATATRRLDGARTALDRAEELYERYQELLTSKRRAELDLAVSEASLVRLRHHEEERRREERWHDLQARQHRLDQARDLVAQLAGSRVTEAPSRELLAAVAAAVSAFENCPDVPPPLDGASVADIEAELAALPTVPVGDIEPDVDVLSTYESFREAGRRLDAHEELPPARLGDAVELPAPPAELRRLAEELETTVPAVDASLSSRVSELLSAPVGPAGADTPSAPERARMPTGYTPGAVAGAAVAVAGIALVVTGRLVVGLVALLVGLVGGAAAVLLGRRSGSPAGNPVQGRELDTSELHRLQARLALQEEAHGQALRRHENAHARLGELALPAEPTELRRLAAQLDAADTARAQLTTWQQKRAVLETARTEAARNLRQVLEAHDIDVADQSSFEDAIDDYRRACRERAELVRQAARRSDLEAQLTSRRAAETSRVEDMDYRERVEGQLQTLVAALHIRAPTPEEAADALRKWSSDEAVLDVERQARSEASARLDQITEGRRLEELEAELAADIATAGTDPASDTPPRPDRSQELEELMTTVRGLRDTVSQLAGQVGEAEDHLPSVCEAIESEAFARAEVDRLTSLGEDLDTARDALSRAKEKIHADIAPLLNATVRPWVPRVTRGRYDDVRVDPATLGLEVRETNGEFRSATVLSHGTTEQLFLLLRLALARHLTTTGETAPLILDEVTVQCDTPRTLEVLGLLHELSEHHQVVLFAQEDLILEWAVKTLAPPADRVVRLPSPEVR